MGVPDHLTGLLRSLYVGQETTVSIRHGITDWLKIGKETNTILICSAFMKGS